jgi:hypothetical protein
MYPRGFALPLRDADVSICVELCSFLVAMPSALASAAFPVHWQAQLIIGAHGQAVILGSS